MGSRMSMAWPLLLFLKVSGLKGELDDSIKLQCYQLLPSSALNCTWFIQRPLDVATTYVLHCQSLKFQPNQTHSERAERGQNWLIIGRSKLTQGENYSIWLEVFSAHWNATSNKLNFNLDDIVKPLPPVLEPVEPDSAGALVTWNNPHWSEFHSHHALMCALRYKTSTDQGWTYLPNEEVGQEGHDLEDLKPFTSYEVQARCIPENGNGFWSDWSLSQIFQTPEAAPLGPVDVWQKLGASENGELSHLLLWKALDPESARGVILDYEVIYQEHNGSTHKTRCPCCNASLPPTAKYAWVSARNSIKKTLPANLSLEQTDLPGPEEVQVVAVPGLGFNVTWKPSASPRWVQPEAYIVEWEEEIVRSKRETLDWIRRPGSSDSALVREEVLLMVRAFPEMPTAVVFVEEEQVTSPPTFRGNFKPKVAYRVGLHGLYPQGRSLPVKVRAYFKEEVPSAGPQALQDRSLSSTASHISWQEIPLASRNGHIIGYTLYLKDPTSRNIARISIAAAKRSYKLSNLKPGTTYQLWMTGSTSAGEGAPSSQRYLSIPGASNWQTVMASIFTVGCLFILAGIVVLIKYRWVLGFCRKILPFWCWQKIPDPGHSGTMLKMNDQSTAPAMDAPTQALGQSPEEMDLVEIKEVPTPEPTPPPARMVNSGYEKHFMPTQEDLQKEKEAIEVTF